MSIAPLAAPRSTRLRSFALCAAMSLLLLGALLAPPASVALTGKQRCLLEGTCVEKIPDRSRSDTPRDAEGYSYKLCADFYGRNYPCKRRFGGRKTWDEFENLEDGLATFQDSLDSQQACACGDDSAPVASLDAETPWATPETPEEGRCTPPGSGPLLPKFYNELFELRSQRSFLIAQKCARGELRIAGYGGLQRRREATCPAGTQSTRRGCERAALDPLKALGQCAGPATPRAGNPVDVASGNKYQRERDYLGAGPAPLVFERHYNSHPGTPPGTLGRQWRHSYERSVLASGYAATYLRADGKVLYFARASAEPDSPWRALDADVVERLEDAPPDTRINDTAVRLLLHTASDAVEAYASNGRLLAITARGGLRSELHYDEWGQLQRVSNPFGRSLQFLHQRGRLREMIDPAGRSYHYDYDADKLLASVSYPSPPEQLWQRQFLYTDADHPLGLTRIINERGLPYASWDYDAHGRVLLSEHAGGADRTLFAYLEDGDVQVTDALGDRSRFRFETSHQLRRKTGESSPCASCGGRSAALSYDAATGFPDVVSDFNGIQSDYDVNARGLETRRVEALGTADERVVNTQWHAQWRLPTRIEAAHAVGEPPRQVTTLTYNDHGQRLSRTVTDLDTQRARTTTWRYTDGTTPGVAAGLLASIDGPRTDVADVTHFTYHADGSGNLHTVRNALGHRTTYTDHDAHGRPTRWLDANGLVTTAHYDERGRLTQQLSDGRSTDFDYDAAGNLVHITLADGNSFSYHYDEANRLQQVLDAHGNRIQYTLDAAGNRTAEQVLDAHGTVVRSASAVFDVLGRLRQRIEGESQTHAYLYDPQGNLTTYTDPGLRPITYAYDALNRMRSRAAEAEGETGFDYDARGNLTRVTDPRGLATDYLYSGLDERIEQHSPDAGSTVFEHDLAGNVITRTDARGILVRYTYDALNRLTERQYPDASENVRLRYDSAPNGIGRLARVEDASGATTFEYDLRGNLRAEHRQLGGSTYTTGYRYDDLDRVVSMTYPSGREVLTTRNVLGQITDLTLDDHATQQVLARGIEYEPFGARRFLERGNGLSEQRTYDRSARLLSLSSAPAMQRSYEYDARNNILAILELDDASRDQRFDYDAANRLSGAEGSYGVLGYSYDELGNRLSRSDNGTADRYSYEASSNRLTQIDGPGATAYHYDAVGNTLARGAQTLAYNDAGRLQQVNGPEGQARFLYNAFGERVTREADGEHSGFVFDVNGMLIAEVDEDGTIAREYVYLDGAPFVLLDAPRPALTELRLTQAATPTLPALELTLDLLHQRLTLHEGSNPPRTLTHGLSIEQPAPGRLTASAPLAPAGRLSLSVTDPNQAPPPHESTVIVHDPPPPTIQSLYGMADGGEPELTMTLRGTSTGYQMKVDAVARTIQLKQHTQPARVLQLADANWIEADLPHAGLHYLIVTEETPQRSVLLWRVNTLNDAPIQLAGLTLREGYPALREYRSPSVSSWTGPRPARTRWYHTDHLGTPIALSDALGNLTWQAQYLPFGTALPGSGDEEQRIRFPGQYSDGAGIGYYNYHRYYDPGAGRYLTSDPIGLGGGLNTYLYGNDNPVRYTDPTGEVAIADDLLIIGGGLAIGACIATNCTKPLSDALGSAVDAIAEFCESDDDECGPDTRAQALRKAQAWAGVPRVSRGREPIPFKDINEQSRGANSAHIQSSGGTHAGFYIPYGRNRVEDHPDGHPHMTGAGQPQHHNCPHFHAVKGSGEERIFTYKRGS